MQHAKSTKLKAKAQAVFRRLRDQHPDATIELNFSSPLELMIATILSAQCTDIKVNQVTAVLFRKFRLAEDYIKRPAAELEQLIRPTGFFRQKAKSIRGAVSKILSDFNGEVPSDMESLVSLPGIGRKTANVILGNAFGIAGLPVDTHVIRLSNRIGLTQQTDPVKIETDLTAVIPKKHWTLFSHTLIFHGRRVCKARKPLCKQCSITSYCDYFRSECATTTK